MKEVLAFIRQNKMNVTKQALTEAGISSLHAKECLGRGKGMVDFAVLKGAEAGYEEAISQLGQSQRLIPKRMLSLVVPGKSGDGKIFVMPVTEAWRVRTGEDGDAVLDE